MEPKRTTLWLILPLCVLPLAGCATQRTTVETRPFYQKEIAVETHGKKTLFDRIVEVDPGGLDVTMADDYEENAPATIAILPFTDKGSAQYTVDKIPLSFRNKQERDQWAWTDAQRLRKSFVGYLSEREFHIVNPIEVDAVLQSHGIKDEADLDKLSVVTLGRWFHCDAVLYGSVDHYEAYYAALVSGYQVGVTSRLVSTHDGETLMRSTGSRYSLNVLPAMTMEDILINSAESLLQLRDVVLARAEEEVARELVIRIPPSETLRTQMASDAIRRAREAEETQQEAMRRPVPPAVGYYQMPPPSQREMEFLAAMSQGDAVDETDEHLNTASSWHPAASQRSVYYSSLQQR